ncbi:hypothetical protein H8356DRAFT_1426672 [Neocallimastix lanati (nom. inval.)]|nr:hypothetical protein H8356DRAFT_1426672 [Neocallimastix sp. JGI-2020a]
MKLKLKLLNPRAKAAKHNQCKSYFFVLVHDVQLHTVKEIIPWFLNVIPEDYIFITAAKCLGDVTLSKVNGKAVPFSSISSGTVPTLEGIIPGSNTSNNNLNTSGDNILLKLMMYMLTYCDDVGGGFGINCFAILCNFESSNDKNINNLLNCNLDDDYAPNFISPSGVLRNATYHNNNIVTKDIDKTEIIKVRINNEKYNDNCSKSTITIEQNLKEKLESFEMISDQ